MTTTEQGERRLSSTASPSNDEAVHIANGLEIFTETKTVGWPQG